MEKEMKICKLSKKGCGGCPFLSIPYEEQLRKKRKEVKKLIGNFGKVRPVLGMEEPWYYRNKAISTFAVGPGRQLISGIYAAGSHYVIPVDTCLLHHPMLDDAVRAVRKAARFCKYQPYNEDRKTGLIRHVLVRHSLLTDELLVVLVTAQPVLLGAKAFVKRVREICPKISTIVQNINPRSTSAVLGYTEKVLYGKGYITDELCGVRFRISASSFYQVNPTQTEVLYRTAIEAAGLDGNQTVLDAYCGVGTIGLAAASHAKSVLGVEKNASAVKCAIQNAKDNGIKNARFVNADATAAIQKMASKGEKVDVIFMDPPRAGSTVEFLDAVDSMNPEKLVYVSCNPETQQRDLKHLAKKGWQVKMIQPVDMFPHTEHVETVALLSRKTASKSFIPVSISPKDMGLSEEKDQPTYANIRDYVQKTYGMKVSSLYVAQMKVECGLETQADRSGDKKQPKCPPEKREAILDAFRHFGLIGEDETEK